MNRRSIFAFPVLLIAAIALQMVSLPDSISSGRPLWVPMVMAYWTYVSPRSASMILAWLTGIVLDVLFNTPLGQHALGLVLVVYLVARARRFMLMVPFWQTSFVVAGVLAVYALEMFWADGVRGQQADVWARWLPVATSALLWPFLFPILSSLGKPSRDE
jgi:rod shape-determining protein MreD